MADVAVGRVKQHMDCPLVSIVIPCYNAVEFIGQAIDSALTQTYERIEVIVIDDGSTDGSLKVVKSYGDHLRWETGPNHGGGAARNRGLELARGEFVQFLDADDLLHPNKLERQMLAAIQEPDAITYCDYEAREYQSRDLLAIYSRDCGTCDPFEFVLANPKLQTSALIHSRSSLIDLGGFCAELPCAQDYDLHLRLACAGARLCHVPEVLYTHRRRAGSVSSDLLRVLDHHERIFQNAYCVLSVSGRLTDRRAAALAGLLATDARLYLRHGRAEQAQRYFKLARDFHPEGGLDGAYRWGSRLLQNLIGPEKTEWLVGLKRKLAGQTSPGW